MRGALPFDLATPVQGLLKDRPTQEVGSNALLDGINMLLDADGYYRPRAGYRRWLTTQPGETLLGMVFFHDTDGTYQYVGAGATQVWAVRNSAWAGQGGNLHGDPDDLATVVPFLQPFIDGATTTLLSAIVANNQDPLVLWNQSLSLAQPLTPIHDGGGGNTLGFSTTPPFTVYPLSNPGPNWFFTVSAGNNGAVTLNINNLGARPLRYVAPTGAIAELPSGFLAPGSAYNVSWDGTQFLVGSNLPAPIARSIAVVNGRVVAVNVVSGAVRVPSQVTWSSVFDASVWPADAFQNLVDTDDPLVAIFKIGLSAAVVYGEESAYLMSGVAGVGDADAFSFTPINGATVGPISPHAVVPWAGGHLYLARDGRVWNTDGINAQPFTIDPSHANGAITALLQAQLDTALGQRCFTLHDTRQRRIWFFFRQISQFNSSAAVLGLDPQPHFETLQIYPTQFTAAASPTLQTGIRIQDLVEPIYSYTQPINSFLNGSEIADLLSDGVGVHLFGPYAGPLDAEVNPVAYSFTPGLLTEGPDKDIRPESFDVFLRPSTFLELVTLQFDALQYPDDPGTTVLAAPFSIGDPASFTQPQVVPELNTYSRYLRLTFSGYSATRAFAYGGARIYTNVQGRPSR